MFERFKKSHRGDSGTAPVATREREARADDAAMEDRGGAVATGDTTTTTTGERFARDDGTGAGQSAGERDRNVVAGGGDADLAADRSFEREDMSRGDDR